MRKREKNRDEISFNGLPDGLTAPEFIKALRVQAFSEDKSNDSNYIATLASTCFSEPALRWFENLPDDVQSDWSLLRRALLTRFPAPDTNSGEQESQSLPALPPYGVQTAGRIVVESWQAMAAPSFLPRTQERWLQEARERRRVYNEVGAGGLTSVHWLLVEKGENIPEAAIQTGVDTHGDQLYCARAWVDGGIHPGKCARHLPGAHIPDGTNELFDIAPYEVLVGDPSAVCWVANPTPAPAGTVPPTRMKPFYAIEGGIHRDGVVYLLAQGHMDRHGWQPGKIGLTWDFCMTGWSRKSFEHKQCRILAWA